MTEIALVGDLHGNLPATMALDADIKARGIQRIWCLGDVIGKGPNSAETFDWAYNRCEFILMGNWDEGIGKKLYEKDEFYYAQLGPRRMRILQELPMEYSFVCSGRKIRLIHGRPFLDKAFGIHQDETYFLPLYQMESKNYDVVGYADVHRQGYRILHNGKILFNTGSVGNGLGLPMVQYAILRGEIGSETIAPFDITMINFPYDREQAIRDTDDAEKRGLVNAELFRQEIRSGQYARKCCDISPIK